MRIHFPGSQYDYYNYYPVQVPGKLPTAGN
jgi:hypothetical protein